MRRFVGPGPILTDDRPAMTPTPEEEPAAPPEPAPVAHSDLTADSVDPEDLGLLTDDEATITFSGKADWVVVNDGGGTLHTHAQITGKAASMGEGVVAGVLDGLIKDFTGKLAAL